MAKGKNTTQIRPADLRRFNNKMMKISMFAANDRGVDIGFDADYAGYVEYGTSKMKAQPYFEPAINNTLIFFKKILKAKGKRLLEGKSKGTASKLLKDLGLAIINNSVSRQNFPVDTGNLRQSVFIKNA